MGERCDIGSLALLPSFIHHLSPLSALDLSSATLSFFLSSFLSFLFAYHQNQKRGVLVTPESLKYEDSLESHLRRDMVKGGC